MTIEERPTVDEASGLDASASGPCDDGACSNEAWIRTVGGRELCTQHYEESLIEAVRREERAAAAERERALRDSLDGLCHGWEHIGYDYYETDASMARRDAFEAAAGEVRYVLKAALAEGGTST